MIHFSFNERSLRKYLIIALVIGFTVRVLYAVLFPANELHIPTDNYYYDAIAKGIVHGEEYHEGNLFAYRPPLYSYFLSALYLTFGINSFSYYMVIFAQSVLSVLSAIIIYYLSLRFISRKGAFLSFVIFCFYPVIIVFCAEILTETLFVFLLVTAFYCIVKGFQEKKLLFLFLGSVFWGLSTLTRELPLYFFPVLLIANLLYESSWKRKILAVSLMTMGLIGTLSPWLIRNYLLFDVPLLSTSGGINFYMGNNSSATGYYLWKMPPQMKWPNEVDFSGALDKEKHQYEIKYVTNCYSEGIKYIKANPEKTALLTLKRIFYFWTPPYQGISLCTVNGSLKIVRFVISLVLSVIALCGIMLACVKKKWGFTLILMWILYSTIFHGLLYVSPRYTLSIVPFLCILAGWVLTSFWQKKRSTPIYLSNSYNHL